MLRRQSLEMSDCRLRFGRPDAVDLMQFLQDQSGGVTNLRFKFGRSGQTSRQYQLAMHPGRCVVAELRIDLQLPLV